MIFHKTNIGFIYRHRYCFVSLIILLQIFTVSCASDNQIKIIKAEDGYQFYEGDSPVLFYRVTPLMTNEATHSRANYCHPVLGLNGESITEDFPKDHLHHRGIFWAWHQVYIGDQLIRDMWDCTDFVWDFQEVTILESDEQSIALTAKINWKSSQWKSGMAPFAQELVTIRLYKVKDNIRKISYEIQISALEEGLRIGGSDDDKGYGGFSTRIPLPDDLQMTDKNGMVTPDRLAVPAGEWLNFSGSFGKKQSGFAVFIHPSNPGETRNWILRKKNSCQNVAYPGREAVAVPIDTPLNLKYQVVIHEDADLEKLFSEYAGKY